MRARCHVVSFTAIITHVSPQMPEVVRQLAHKSPSQIAKFVADQANVIDDLKQQQQSTEEQHSAFRSERHDYANSPQRCGRVAGNQVGKLREAMRSQAAAGGHSYEREMARLRVRVAGCRANHCFTLTCATHGACGWCRRCTKRSCRRSVMHTVRNWTRS